MSIDGCAREFAVSLSICCLLYSHSEDPMTTDKLAFIRADMDALAESNLFITLRTMDSPADAWMVVDGKRVLNFCTNNYLGLANHPRMKEAAQGRDGPLGRRAGRGALHRRHAGAARRAGAPAGRVQGGGGRALRPERLLRQPGRHRAAGRQGGRDLLRPAQPRLHHRRRAAQPAPRSSSTSTATRPTASARSRSTCPTIAAGCSSPTASSAWTATSRRWTS